MTYQRPGAAVAVVRGQQPPAPQWPSVPPARQHRHAERPSSSRRAGPPPAAGPRPVTYPAAGAAGGRAGHAVRAGGAGAPKTASGVAASALVAGVGSILVSLVVWCFGVAGAQQGWGGLVAGAFAVLSILLGRRGAAGGSACGRSGWPRAAMTGRGVAIAGLVCGAVGLLLAAVGSDRRHRLSAG